MIIVTHHRWNEEYSRLATGDRYQHPMIILEYVSSKEETKKIKNKGAPVGAF